MSKFIILGQQRTGSTLLQTLLDSHPETLCLGEMLHKQAAPGTVENFDIVNWKKFFSSNPEASLDDYINQIYEPLNMGYPKSIGFRLMLPDTSDQILDILKKKDVKVILLIRRNYLKTIISCKFLALTHINTISQKKDKTLTKVRLDEDRILPLLDSYKNTYKQMKDTLINKKFDYIKIHYSEYSNNYNSKKMKDVLNFLELNSSITLDTPLLKMHSDNIQDVLINYTEIEKKLIGTEYELFLK